MKSARLTKPDLFVSVLFLVFVAALATATTRYGHLISHRTQCANNLQALGVGMLMYTDDNNTKLPYVGYSNYTWNHETDWDDNNLSLISDKLTVTSHLYPFLTYINYNTSRFICPGDRIAEEFTLTRLLAQLPPDQAQQYQYRHLSSLKDFGPWIDWENNPSVHCSYATHWPFDKMALRTTTTSKASLRPLAADRNPWMDPNRVKDPFMGWDRYTPTHLSPNDPEAARLGNSDNHLWTGQNVLYLDFHVEFAQDPTCGLDNDNIYTAQDPNLTPEQGSLVKGKRPQVYTDTCRPVSREDSVLIQEYGKNFSSP